VARVGYVRNVHGVSIGMAYAIRRRSRANLERSRAISACVVVRSRTSVAPRRGGQCRAAGRRAPRVQRHVAGRDIATASAVAWR